MMEGGGRLAGRLDDGRAFVQDYLTFCQLLYQHRECMSLDLRLRANSAHRWEFSEYLALGGESMKLDKERAAIPITKPNTQPWVPQPRSSPSYSESPLRCVPPRVV